MIRPRHARLALGVLVAASLCGSIPTSVAHAKSCNKRLVVMDFLGPQNANVRTAIVRTLEAQGCDFVTSKSANQTARRLGLRLRDADDYARLAKKLKVQGFVEGAVSKKGRRWSADVSVRNGQDGEVLKSTSFGAPSSRALARQVQRSAWQRLAGAIEVSGTREAAESEATSEGEAKGVAPRPAKRTGIRVGVLRARGAMANEVRKEIEATLRGQGHDVLNSADVDAVAEALVASPSSAEDYQQLAAELHAHAIVSARIKKRGKAYIINAEAHNGRDGGSLTATTGMTRNRNNLGATAKVTAERISPKLANGQLPAKEGDKSAEPQKAKEKEAERVDADEHEKDTDQGGGTYNALDISVGPRLFSRSLSYADNIRNDVRGYNVFPASGIVAGLTWFPGAHVTDGVLAHLGLTASYATSIGLTSAVEGASVDYDSKGQSYQLGLLGRIPLDTLDLYLVASYGSQSFSIDHGDALSPRPDDIPNVDYKHLRAGLGARWQLDEDWAVLGGAGYRFVTNAGEIEEKFFPRLSIGAFDVDIGAAYRLFAGFELRFTIDMQRYFMTMNPEVGDPYVAGGAVDQWFAATLAAAYRL